MKKIHLLSSIFILTILLSGTTLAEVSTTTLKKNNVVAPRVVDLKQKVLDDRAKMLKLATTSAEKLRAQKQELVDKVEIKIGKKLDEQKIKIANGFEKAVSNLKEFLSRIESRVEKMALENIDVSSSRLLIAAAKEKITLAEIELISFENSLSVNIPATSTSTTKNNERKTLLKKLNSESEKVRSAIKTAHRSIVDVISSLKRGLEKDKRSTSTREVVSTSTNNQ